MEPARLRIAVFGTGYWAQFQIAAWQSIGADVVAVWNRTHGKAAATAARFGIPFVAETPEDAFSQISFDIADIITDVDAHAPLVRMAAEHHQAVICQKPMAFDWPACRQMVETCSQAGVWFAIHENFRYQPPFQAVKKALADARFGRVLHAHVQMKSPDRSILVKQPALAVMDHMALRDMGPHIFDVIRDWFGDVAAIDSRPVVSYADVGVQDSALSLLDMASGLPVLCTLAHHFAYKASIQCEHGTILLDRDNMLHLTVDGRTDVIDTRNWPILDYIPADDWQIHGGHVFTAIPRCLEALRDHFLAGMPAETSGADNLETMRTVFAAMRSQDEKRRVALNEIG